MCWTKQGRDSHSLAQGNPGLLPSAGPVSCQELLVFLQKSQAWPIWIPCHSQASLSNLFASRQSERSFQDPHLNNHFWA